VLFSFETYVLDTAKRELRRGAETIALEPQVFDLLAYLIRNRDRVVTQDDLLTGVWQGRIVSESTLRSRLTAARAAVGDDGEQQRLIRTLPRKGVRFVGTVREQVHEQVREEVREEVGTADPAEQRPANAAATAAAAQRQALLPKLVGSPITRLVAMVAAVVALGVTALAWYWFSGAADRKHAVAAAAFDPLRVPFLDDRTRQDLAHYPQEPDFKAIAIARRGWGMASGAGDVDSAKVEALARCRHLDQMGQCRIYAIGNDVIWSSPHFPLPLDVRAEPLDTPLTPEHGMLFGGTGRAIEAHLKERDHKAFAVGVGSFSAHHGSRSRAEAVRLVVERCSDRLQKPCLLIGVDGFLTHRLPQSRRIIGPFTLAGETDVAPADRQRIEQVYGGKDWRALARGLRGSLHPVADASSEAAAIEAALQACAKVDSDCRLYAIGSFRVAHDPR
jgi:DNA-binding winged helix-turn-helix (wHTH) protein